MIDVTDVRCAPCITQLRRARDDAVADFYPVAISTGGLNTAASGAGDSVATWAGTNTTLYVDTWYDQAMGKHATSSATSSQPVLVWDSRVGWTSRPIVRFMQKAPEACADVCYLSIDPGAMLFTDFTVLATASRLSVASYSTATAGWDLTSNRYLGGTSSTGASVGFGYGSDAYDGSQIGDVFAHRRSGG